MKISYFNKIYLLSYTQGRREHPPPCDECLQWLCTCATIYCPHRRKTTDAILILFEWRRHDDVGEPPTNNRCGCLKLEKRKMRIFYGLNWNKLPKIPVTHLTRHPNYLLSHSIKNGFVSDLLSTLWGLNLTETVYCSALLLCGYTGSGFCPQSFVLFF